MFRKTIFERMLEGVSRVALRPSADAGGTTIVADGGGGGGSPASSPSSSPSGGGSGDSPSGSPATPTPAEPSDTTSTPSDPWAGLGAEVLDDEIEIPAEPPTPAPAPAPAAPQPAPPQPQQVPPQTPPQNPPAQPAAPAQEAPQAATPMPSPAEPAALAAFMLDPANRAQILDHIARDRYALSDAEVQELTEDAVVAVPKLLARAHLETTASLMRFMEQSIPSFIQRHTEVSNANKQAETKFFGAAPGLDQNNPKHVSAAKRIVGIYRQMNPDAKFEDVVAICAPMVLQAVGGNAPSPSSPSPTPAPRPVPQAFQPAIGSNGAPTQPQANSPWDGLGQDFDEE